MKAQGRQRRQRMDDIAQRAGLDEQNAPVLNVFHKSLRLLKILTDLTTLRLDDFWTVRILRTKMN
jgi:hypothetical protein